MNAADLGAPISATDAVVTTDPTVVLTVMVADCVPVLLYDADAGVIAAAMRVEQVLEMGWCLTPWPPWWNWGQTWII